VGGAHHTGTELRRIVMNMKMCFVNTAMAATCIAAGGGMIPTEEPPREPPVRSPSPSWVEGKVHTFPGEEPGAQEQAEGAAARPPFGTSQNACGVPDEHPEAPNDVQRSADQWERWFQAHNMK
jgi:hypothetical protein